MPETPLTPIDASHAPPVDSALPTDRPPTIAEIYGQAYLLVEHTGGQQGLTHLVYELENRCRYSEDAASYFGGPQSWFPADVVGCEKARGRVLDLGCGAGRHALALQAAGHKVVGVEPSAAAAVARRRGVDARRGDLWDLPTDLGRFDTFLLLGGNLGMLIGDPRRQAALTALAALAAPDAQLLGSDFEDPDADEPARLRARIEHGGYRSPWSHWSGGEPYLPAERLPEVLHGTGWRLAGIHRVEGEPPGGYLVRLRLAKAPPHSPTAAHPHGEDAP
ncbi:class I SAM-dependent methyltransferase [Salinactinospora qingdaonensis]|uniref:Methyltransferase domain-containing protein n=1 Tax=Salinactinospora qingdaonensis TaxID=702744 RepID=A0ABP7FJI3_9ACTN